VAVDLFPIQTQTGHPAWATVAEVVRGRHRCSAPTLQSIARLSVCGVIARRPAAERERAPLAFWTAADPARASKMPLSSGTAIWASSMIPEAAAAFDPLRAEVGLNRPRPHRMQGPLAGGFAEHQILWASGSTLGAL
jgi:hypothetical protein